jgi:uncharacterized protein
MTPSRYFQTRPLPEPAAHDAPFWAATREHRLVLPRCQDCGHVWFPPYSRCTRCASNKIEWMDACGRGRVWGFIEMHRKYIEWFASEIPYNVALIKLEEGAFIYSNIVDSRYRDTARYEDIRIDAPVEIKFIDVNEKITLPLFRLAREGE